MFASQAPIPLPDSFQHYRVDRCVLNVGLLRVYQVWDSKLQRAALMHIIRQQAPGFVAESNLSEEPNDVYLLQARRVAALQHPAFIRIHALEEFQQQLILMTEAVSGISLTSWIRDHPGQRERALKHLMHLSVALHEAHSAGLSGGDLRSANLLLDTAGTVRLPSVSLVLHQTTAMHEQNQQDDVFSLALLLFEMMTGHMPDYGQAGPLGIQDPVFPWPENFPPDLRALILDMTEPQQSLGLNCLQVAERCRQLLAVDASFSSAAMLNIDVLKQEIQRSLPIRQRRPRLTMLSIGVLALMLGGVGVWQLQAYFPAFSKYLTPYSESYEMAQAARDLAEYTYKTDARLLDTAEAHLNKVLQRSPEHAPAVAYMSILYLSKYNTEKRDEIWFQKAKASAQQAMTLDPSMPVSLVAQAKILQWHHRLDEALAMAARARELSPDNLLAWQSQVSILLEMGKYSDAIPLAEQGANLFLQDRFLLDLQGGMYMTQKKYADAERVLRISLQRQPDSPLAYSLLAECLTSQQRDADALQVIQQGLQVRSSPNLYGALAHAKFRAGDYVAAAEAFAMTVSRDRGIAGSYLRWFEYAESLIWVAGREADAISAFQRALELLDIRLQRSPDDETLLSTKSVILARLHQDAEAKVVVSRTIARQSEDPEVHFLLAYTFELLHEREQALAELKLSKQLGMSLRILDTHPGLRSLRADPRYLGS